MQQDPNFPGFVKPPCASTLLFEAAREIKQLAQDALDCASPGPRRDMERSKALLAIVERKAAEVARG